MLGLGPDLWSAVDTGRVGRRVDDGRLIILGVVVSVVLTGGRHGPLSNVVDRLLIVACVLCSRVIVARVLFQRTLLVS